MRKPQDGAGGQRRNQVVGEARLVPSETGQGLAGVAHPSDHVVNTLWATHKAAWRLYLGLGEAAIGACGSWSCICISISAPRATAVASFDATQRFGTAAATTSPPLPCSRGHRLQTVACMAHFTFLVVCRAYTVLYPLTCRRRPTLTSSTTCIQPMDRPWFPLDILTCRAR